jgi:hypothetical protein
MPLTWAIDREAGIVRVTAQGQVSLEHERDSLLRILAHPDHTPGLGILLDNRERRPAATPDHVRAMAGVVSEVPDRLGRMKLAIVVSRDVSFGMARMFAILSEASTMRTSIFRDVDEAEAWLRGKS